MPKGQRNKYQGLDIVFSRLLVRANDCWEFKGYLDKWGYGRIGIHGKNILVHRAAYCCENNVPIDSIKGKLVMHTCDNPSCCNPDHLLLGTDADNARDMSNKLRQWKTILTIDQVVEIFTSNESGISMAKKFGVSQSCVCTIRKGITLSGITKNLIPGKYKNERQK